MNNQRINLNLPTRVPSSIISDYFTKNYQKLNTEFFEFQFDWLNRAYAAFKDFDKYLILAYLFRKTFFSYSELFKVVSFEKFFSNRALEVEKFNIIDISKDLMMSKETTRRKVLEFERDGIISKSKKLITLNFDAFNIHRPEASILSFSRLLASMSKILYDNKVFKKTYQREFYVEKIKKKFTQVWGIFLDYQINYIVSRSALLKNDIEMFHIFGSLVYNQNLFMKKNGKSNHYRDEWWRDIVHMGDKKGISAMTISDLTCIPRPTVIRKLNKLLDGRNVIKDKNNLYSFKDGPLMKKFNDIRMQNVEALSNTISSINNIVIEN
jgi:hypothetical protein